MGMGGAEAARVALAQARSYWQTELRNARLALRRVRSPADRAERESQVNEMEGTAAWLEDALAAVVECAKGLDEARREHETVQLARERLKTHPDDPAACLTVGRWLCFDRNDWDEGLKLLAKGSDDALRTLAAKELTSEPSTADARVARGHAWWDLAEKSEGRARSALRRRAGQWYEEALPELSGLVQKRVEARLAQVSAEPAPAGESARVRPPLAVAPFDARTARLHRGRWEWRWLRPFSSTSDIFTGRMRFDDRICSANLQLQFIRQIHGDAIEQKAVTVVRATFNGFPIHLDRCRVFIHSQEQQRRIFNRMCRPHREHAVGVVLKFQRATL